MTKQKAARGVQGSPCRGFGGVPQYFPFHNTGCSGNPAGGLGVSPKTTFSMKNQKAAPQGGFLIFHGLRPMD
ncbi:MAG: hypothetical protein ACJ78Q_11350, partial [Chloroflexia bacterium]